MILSFSEQTKLFLYAVLIGAGMGLFFDCFRILRKAFSHSSFLVQLEDGIYWAAMAVCVFRLLLDANDGQIRFFLFLGMFDGAILYFFTFSRLLIPMADQVIFIANKCISIFIEIMFTPFRLLWLILRRPVLFWRNFFRKKMNVVLHFRKLCAKIKDNQQKKKTAEKKSS
ncbi:MAG: spore cortex biosynthesis protein YabQ [Clostridiales bacterium]|nr:spore cortex biosynthesis protein YabQ [Clostridiales bacterium]